MALSRRGRSSWGCTGSGTTRSPSGSSPCAGTGARTGWGAPQRWTATSLGNALPAGMVAEFHVHGTSRAFFSAADDRVEPGFCIDGVVRRRDTARPELCLRVGVDGHLAPVGWSQVFDGPHPGDRLVDKEPVATNLRDGGDCMIDDVDHMCLLDDPWMTLVGCGGTGGFVAEDPCCFVQGRKANIDLGRPRSSLTTCCARIPTQ